MAAKTLFVAAAWPRCSHCRVRRSRTARTTRIEAPGLERHVDVIRDELGVPTSSRRARTTRTSPSATCTPATDCSRWTRAGASERHARRAVGPSALAGDAQLRTFGLRRAAARSLAELSPKSKAILEAYSQGVNAWLAANPLPSEYAVLELTKAQVPAWTPLDSAVVTKLIAFGLSFDLGDLTNTQRLIAYQTAGAALGFDGRKLFFEDVMRSEPFAHRRRSSRARPRNRRAPRAARLVIELAERYDVAEAADRAVTKAERAGIAVERSVDTGSNVFVVSGTKSASGRPMVASDPHLSLGSPATFYEVGVDVNGRKDERLTLYGVTFPGSPAVVHGTNGAVSWGSTVNPTDVTDVYQEQLVISSGVPVATMYKGTAEPTQVIPETFRANQPGNGAADDIVVVPPAAGVPAATIVVPRRNNGPIISVTGTTGLWSSSPASAPPASSTSSGCSRTPTT